MHHVLPACTAFALLQVLSNRSSNPCTSRTAPFRSVLASAHSLSVATASSRKSDCSRSSPSRRCSVSWACVSGASSALAGPLAAVSAGAGAGADDVAEGEGEPGSVATNFSTSGRRLSRTLESSARIWAMVDSSVRGAAFSSCRDEGGGGPPAGPVPMMARVELGRMP
jgi:hypothetical protein